MKESCQKSAPQKIIELVAQFKRDYEHIKTYNEETIRQNYINPFFNELAWDVYDKKGIPEVIPEDKIKVEGKTKAPDYGFYLNDQRKFFLEAKKPSVHLHKGSEADKSALQLRRYGWSASLHISVLTNFEELVIYNCRVKPHKDDPASKARIKYFTFEQYIDKWQEISDLLSRDAVSEGKLEKYVESEESEKFLKSDIIPVDDDFLQVIENWRENLAKSLVKRNRLSIFELNFAVQTIINRIVFLRICEDLGIEPYQILFKAAETKNYQVLCKLFREADNRYNSGLFHFTPEKNRTEPDKLTLNLKVDETYLYEIVRDIYPPNSPYEFSVIPVELLGHIYEQFLGKVIVLNKKNSVSVEDKPEVRKAGGVYYTPDYIVNYIVENTVGELLKDKTPQQVEKIKVLDPACGSGSFLVGAYHYLLNWHKKHYKKDKLTAQEKKHILLNNIYGVDIDRQAVEVTKLSLLLKVLEDETERSIDREKVLFKERVLPDLDNNIKCGNSLISSDFYDNEQNDILDEDLRHKVNTFDWENEFSDILKTGGFDAIIGNPPWVDIKGMPPNLVDYYFSTYPTTQNRMNIYATFLHKGIELIKEKSILGYITPCSFHTQSSYKKLRQFILENTFINNIVRLPDTIFKNVTAESAIIILKKHLEKNFSTKDCEILIYSSSIKLLEISAENANFIKNIPIKVWQYSEDFIFDIYVDEKEHKVIENIGKNKVNLLDVCDFSLGLTPYDKYKGHSQTQIQNKVFHSDFKKDDTFKPLLSGSEIQRYFIKWAGLNWISYGNWLGAPREPRFFREPRILVRQIISGKSRKIYAGYTEEELYNAQIGFNLLIKQGQEISLKYILGLLNSKMMTFYHKKRFLDESKQIFQKILIQDAKKFPIYLIDLKNKKHKANHDKMVKLVDRMLILHKQLNIVKIVQDKQLIQRQIDKTDKEIDSLVYQLYDLTTEEITIVEGQKVNE